MARIRSVHPGLFTDEAFVELSDAAQVFLIGLWTEADDQGIFEWKPTTLRIRLRPGKDGSVDGLLSELEAANCIRNYEMNGRQLGAIRNFRKYQRPKSPNSLHLTTEEIRNYTGSASPISEMDGVKPVPFPPKVEKPPQMEGREGGEKEGKKDDSGPGLEKYAFEAGIIRLKQKDFDRWQQSFKYLNLAAELTGLAEWAGRPEQASKWFSAVSGALAKRDRQALHNQEKLKLEVASGQARDPADWRNAIL